MPSTGGIQKVLEILRQHRVCRELFAFPGWHCPFLGLAGVICVFCSSLALVLLLAPIPLECRNAISLWARMASCMMQMTAPRSCCVTQAVDRRKHGCVGPKSKCPRKYVFRMAICSQIHQLWPYAFMWKDQFVWGQEVKDYARQSTANLTFERVRQTPGGPIAPSQLLHNGCRGM